MNYPTGTIGIIEQNLRLVEFKLAAYSNKYYVEKPELVIESGYRKMIKLIKNLMPVRIGKRKYRNEKLNEEGLSEL